MSDNFKQYIERMLEGYLEQQGEKAVHNFADGLNSHALERAKQLIKKPVMYYITSEYVPKQDVSGKDTTAFMITDYPDTLLIHPDSLPVLQEICGGVIDLLPLPDHVVVERAAKSLRRSLLRSVVWEK